MHICIPASPASFAASPNDYKTRQQTAPKRVAAGEDQTVYEDDETGQTFDYGEYTGEQRSNADETLRIVREAFLLSLHHYWEKQVRRWMKVKEYEQDKALTWLKAEGLTPDKHNLDVLRMAANCIKHNNKAFYNKYPKFFDATMMSGQTQIGMTRYVLRTSILMSFSVPFARLVPIELFGPKAWIVVPARSEHSGFLTYKGSSANHFK